MEAVLRTEGLVHRFGSVTAVNNLSFSVAPGEVFGLVGPDGAGKTTTMRMLCGLLRPDAGSVDILGFSIPGEVRKARPHMGYMPQSYSLYLDLSVQENLRFFAGMFGVEKSVLLEREKRLLEIARLDTFRDRPAGALSGGMYKKLALACALMHQPKLLLLDEPTNGVDPISRRELWSFLYELVDDGVSVLVSTPYMDEAERCARVGLIQDGGLVAIDSPSRLKKNFDRRVFAIETDRIPDSFEMILALPFVEDAYLLGQQIHVVVSGDGDVDQTLRTVLENMGLQTKTMHVVPPSFEDVFLTLTRRTRHGGADG